MSVLFECVAGSKKKNGGEKMPFELLHCDRNLVQSVAQKNVYKNVDNHECCYPPSKTAKPTVYGINDLDIPFHKCEEKAHF